MLDGLPRPVKIVLGIAVAIPLVGLAAAFVAASLLSARVSGNESSAIGSLRAISSAQATFAASECQGLYAPDLRTLAASGVISPDLSGEHSVEKSGYLISLRPGKADPTSPDAATAACRGGATGVRTYTATAVPLEPGTTGVRYFITDQEFTIKQATSAAFTDATPVR
jgi:hypothetical protein